MKKRKSKIDNFEIIKMFKEVHNDLYDYSLVNYKTMHYKVCIICKEHGEFLQEPNQHYRRKAGCPKCANNRCKTKLKDTVDNFIKKSIKIHGNLYNYDKVDYLKNAHEDVIIICPLHGEFKLTPNEHLSKKCGCKKCSLIKKRKTTEQFIKEAKKIHNNKYDYSLVEYTTNVKNIKIICPEHGIFEQSPINHIFQKHGCQKCGFNLIGFNRTKFKKICKIKNRIAKLYFIHFYNNNEEFIKIGITSKSVEKRFRSENKLGYAIKIIKYLEGEASKIWNMEKKLHKKFKEFKHIPKINFNGSTECFNINIKSLIENIN